MPERTILVWLLIGLLTGVAARFVLPARVPGGFVTTILIGIAGALAAGFLSRATGLAYSDGWQEHGWALAGAVLLIILYRLVAARRLG